MGGDTRSEKGLRGEEEARRHLEALGYRILATRWRCRYGELDIVARDGDTLVFVEVRSRGSTRCGYPEETIGAAKRRRLIRTVGYWLLQRQGAANSPCRFDVIAISRDAQGAAKPSVPAGAGRPSLVHILDAFRLHGT